MHYLVLLFSIVLGFQNGPTASVGRVYFETLFCLENDHAWVSCRSMHVILVGSSTCLGL